MAMDELGLKNMNDVMGDLFESKNGVDVTFIVHEKELQAHKWILTSRSAVFKAMLEGPMAPEDQRHKISDPKITFEDFQRFLKFLYIDKCEQNLNKSQLKALIHLGKYLFS
uniref:BTB domain-containing protein n=1 Tax=Panagrolaimus sp. PS1159 TaxID=55785 RepID=A0AC35F0B5_9BILA